MLDDLTGPMLVFAPVFLDSWPPLAGELRIYLLNPPGNLMMSYPIDADLADLGKCIGWLSRASHIG